MSVQPNDPNTTIATTSAKTASPAQQAAILWGIAALILAIVACTVTSSPLVLRAGFFTKTFAVLVGTVMGTLFAVIGDAIRRYAHPDMIITNGGFFSLIGAKLFWQVGPQLIGVFIGVFLGEALVLK